MAFSLTSTLSAAEEPAKTQVQQDTETTVSKKFLKPLIAKEEQRSRLSRARLPPSARRVRVIDSVAQKDGKGNAFVSFAVDNKWGYEFDEDEAPRKSKEDSWTKNVITGCLYPATGEIFVKYGKDFRAADVLLGKKTPVADASVCKSDAAQVATKN